MAKKIDLFRDNRDEYAMPREPRIVAVRAGRYLTVSGEADQVCGGLPMEAAILSRRRRHHEIYLSDPRRVPASRLRTILRHPVAPGRRRIRIA